MEFYCGKNRPLLCFGDLLFLSPTRSQTTPVSFLLRVASKGRLSSFSASSLFAFLCSLFHLPHIHIHKHLTFPLTGILRHLYSPALKVSLFPALFIIYYTAVNISWWVTSAIITCRTNILYMLELTISKHINYIHIHSHI